MIPKIVAQSNYITKKRFVYMSTFNQDSADLAKVIEGNKKLIETYTQKIQDRINKVWGESE